MTRILHVLLEPRMGGPQLRILSVSNGLQRLGFETAVVLPEGEAPFAQVLETHEIPVFRTPLSRLRSSLDPRIQLDVVRRIPGGVSGLVRIIRQWHADIVHIHGLYQPMGALAARLAGRPLVWHLNDLLLPKMLARAAAPAVLATVDAAITVSQAVRRYLFDGLDERGKVVTVYDPPVREVEGTPTSTRNEQENLPTLLTVGNLYRVKGHATLLEAFARMRTRARLELLGAPLDTQPEVATELYRLRSSLELEDRVQFLGWQEAVGGYLQGCTLYVHPSQSEACPLAVLEAMNAGKAVVATAVGGVPELVVPGETGWLVDADPWSQVPERLAQTLDDALSDSERLERFGRAGAARVATHFSLEQCIQRHAAVYHAVLEGRRSGNAALAALSL